MHFGFGVFSVKRKNIPQEKATSLQKYHLIQNRVNGSRYRHRTFEDVLWWHWESTHTASKILASVDQACWSTFQGCLIAMGSVEFEGKSLCSLPVVLLGEDTATGECCCHAWCTTTFRWVIWVKIASPCWAGAQNIAMDKGSPGGLQFFWQKPCNGVMTGAYEISNQIFQIIKKKKERKTHQASNALEP